MAILIVLGGVIAALNTQVGNPLSLVQLGIAAPALLTSYINATSIGSGDKDSVKAKSDSSMIISRAFADETLERRTVLVDFWGDVSRGFSTNLGGIVGQQQQQQQQQQIEQQQQQIKQFQQQIKNRLPESGGQKNVFDGLGWTYDVFYCREDDGNSREARAIADKIANTIGSQKNVPRVRVRLWPSFGTVDPISGDVYNITGPFDIRVTQQRDEVARQLKVLLDPVVSQYGKFQFTEIESIFPYYISMVICPDPKQIAK